jgi:hypothetical protein
MDPEAREAISRGQIDRYKRQAEDLSQIPEKRFCPFCSEWKTTEGNFVISKRLLKSGRMGFYPAHKCNECKKIEKREWRAKNRDHVRELQRRSHARRMKNKEKREARQRYAREYGRMQRALQGANPRGPWKRYAHEVGGPLKLVPAKPFIEWYLALDGKRPSDKQLGLATARAVRRAITGDADSADFEDRRIRLHIVDEVGVIVGEPYLIHTLYGGM